MATIDAVIRVISVVTFVCPWCPHHETVSMGPGEHHTRKELEAARTAVQTHARTHIEETK